MRYNGPILTANIADPGIKFKEVPDVCGVFLSRFDLFKGGHVRYHVDRVAREAGKVVGNGFTEVYVNAKDGSVLAELMDVFVRDDAYSERFPITSRCKRRYKEIEEGQRAMREIMERIAERLEQRAEDILDLLSEIGEVLFGKLDRAMDDR